jgi:hypothetical protein
MGAMIVPPRHKRPRDLAQFAKSILDDATGESNPLPAEPAKNPAAQALSRLGAAKGGAARAKALSPTKRRQIAKKAAAARWKR